MRHFILLIACFWTLASHAEILENDPRITIRTIEPDRDVGYTVGDTLTRTIILEAPQHLQIAETSLPIAGNDKKRRGHGSGIEATKVEFEKSSGTDKNRFTLRLTYQVFTRNVAARPAALPAEFVKFVGKDGNGKAENFDFRIPSWSFRISPLAVYGSVVVERDMSTFRGPLLRDATPHTRILWALLAVFGLSLLGLFYLLGTTTWLPRMGGPFARACRDLKKLPDTPEGLSQGVARLHHAFNATVGNSVFDAASFLVRKPGFAPVDEEIGQFFQLSRTVFFEPSAPHGIDHPHAWLRQFCRRCRDCERGLK